MLCWESWWMVKTSWVMLFNNPEISVAYKHKHIFLSHAVCMSHGLSGAPHWSLQAEVFLIVWNDSVFSSRGRKNGKLQKSYKRLLSRNNVSFLLMFHWLKQGTDRDMQLHLMSKWRRRTRMDTLCWPPQIAKPMGSLHPEGIWGFR